MEDSNQQLASRWKRLIGATIDGLLMMLIAFPIMKVIGIFPQGQGMPLGQHILGSVIGIVIFLGLHGYFLAKNGQTIGKKIVKTRIVNINGELCPFAKMFVLRYVILWIITMIPIIGTIYGIVDSLFIFGKEKRCIHDYIAGTKVIYA